MTKKLSNAQARGYQLWYEFSVMRRVSIAFQYSCPWFQTTFWFHLWRMDISVSGYFSLKNLWREECIPLMGLKFKGCTQKPVTFMDLLLSCHTHWVQTLRFLMCFINLNKCSECPNIDTRQRLNRVHFCYTSVYMLVVPKHTHFNNIWLSFKIFSSFEDH